MSDLDHLDDIAEATAFGYQGISPLHNVAHKHRTEYCGGGHLWTDETTRWYIYRFKRRRICRICDAARHKPKQCSSISPSIAPGIAQAGAKQ